MALPLHRNDAESESWDPVPELEQLTSRLRGYLDRWSSVPSFLQGPFTPLADVEETEDSYLVEVELPGVKREDVTVEVAGTRLTVSGERKERERVGILRRRTRTVGRFHYEVTLPGVEDDEEVSASMHEGVLTIRVPKPARDRPRKIPIG
ncbi:MAG: Hsp20/alpha crystallin family protein [Actinomycetota bacterium]|nr:Hsp20/alpha crystallin family protein [Actinomycetota bacterium]